MNKITLTRFEHNGIECRKDVTKLFMVVKEFKGTYCLMIAKQHNSECINELHAWGYENYRNGLKTLNEVKEEIEHYLKYGAWFDSFQRGLAYNTYQEIMEH